MNHRSDKPKPIRIERQRPLPFYRPFNIGFLNPRLNEDVEKKPAAIGFVHHRVDDDDAGDDIVVMPYGRKRVTR